MPVEAEQRAWNEQGKDRNHEVFPLILDVRYVLRTNGVPLRPGSRLCGTAAFSGRSPRHYTPYRTSPVGRKSPRPA